MKQCAGCGRRYVDTQPNCPGCWSKTWVAVPETGVAELPENPVPCTECGYLASAGTAQCPHCRKALRPRALTWLGLLGLIGSPLAIIYLVYLMATTRNFWHLVLIVICAAIPVVFRGLLRGEYSAFQRMRLLLIGIPSLLVLACLVALIAHNALAAAMLGSVFLPAAIAALALWFVFHSPAVQDYCALGRPKEQYEAKSVFLEQTHSTKAQRMGSTLTRNL